MTRVRLPFRILTALLLTLWIVPVLEAQVQPAPLFASHMVLQRNKPIVVWGQAARGEKVTLSLADQKKTVQADRIGNWQLSLPAMPAGGPYTMLIRGKKNEIQFDDIYIGDVWVCSGQSNMEWSVVESADAQTEIATANQPLIRHIKIPHSVNLAPQSGFEKVPWEICSPATVGRFTAVGYSFAREIQKDQQVAIGLINSSWGGTMVETWISGESFFGHPEFAALKSSMPASMEEVIARSQQRTQNLIQKTVGTLPSQADAFRFREAGWNDQSWPTMQIPSAWEWAGLPELDGTVWFRKVFHLPADMRLDNPVLSLGPIDDADSTFVNGQFVGATDNYQRDRIYTLPPRILRVGPNVIAVKVRDGGGGGGIYGKPEQLYVKTGQLKTSLAGEWKYMIEQVLEGGGGVHPNTYPTMLYNTMIHPIIRFPIKGVIWYQGEDNAQRAKQYEVSFPLMIEDWRKQWKDSLPFYFVQLTAFGGPRSGTSQNGGSNWAELRESQGKALRLPHTGMAVIIDLGESDDIHPRNKQDVGKRLAALALSGTYGRFAYTGSPFFDDMQAEGNNIRVKFRNTGKGLTVRNRYGHVNGFELAGVDRKFHYARAWLEGNEVVVNCDRVTQPVAVRYGWANDPSDLNLFSEEGLPVTPFRSDNWPGKTDEVKYTLRK